MAAVYKPVQHSHKSGAAQNVSEGHGEKIVQEHSAPGQVLQSISGHQSGGDGGSRQSLGMGSQNPGRDVVHVGNAVFKTGGDKQENGKEDPQDLAGHIFGAGSLPYRKTYQPVAQESQYDGFPKGKTDLAGCDLDGHDTQVRRGSWHSRR